MYFILAWNYKFRSFGSEKYDAIYDRIRYLINQKIGTTYVLLHNYARIKISSYDFLTLVKTLTTDNVIILIKSLRIIKITSSIIYS